MGDLQKVIASISETPAEKAMGIGALLQSANRNMILSNVSETNRGEVSSLLDIIGGADTSDVYMILKGALEPSSVAGNPYMEKTMQKYNISQQQLMGFNRSGAVQQAILGLSMGMAGQTGGAGISQVMLESLMNLSGMPLSPDMMTQAQQLRMINEFGTTGRFTAGRFQGELGREQEYLKTFGVSPWEQMNVQTFQEKFLPIVNAFTTDFGKTRDVFESFDKVLPRFTIAMEEVRQTIEKLMTGIRRTPLPMGMTEAEYERLKQFGVTVTGLPESTRQWVGQNPFQRQTVDINVVEHPDLVKVIAHVATRSKQ